MRTSIKIILISSLIFIFTLSCTKVKHEPESDCLSKSNKNSEIMWGFYKQKERIMFGHKISSSGDIFAHDNIKQKDSLLGFTSKKNMCNLVKSIQDEFIMTQSLNVPADSVVFIELFNPNTRVRLKASWNPRLPSIGSKGFRAIWKSLDSTLAEGVEG
jgi:hypothetical protein